MSDQAPQELNTLAKRAMDGDEDAFNQLYSTFFDIASRYSHRLPKYIQEEFLQDMGKRLIICLKERKWEDTGAPFEAWIHVTAFNTVSEWRKRFKLHSEKEIQDPDFPYTDVEDSSISTEDQILQREEKGILWSAVMKLPEIQAQVIYERHACGKSFLEIGDLVGKTEENCRQIHQRALKKLKDLIRCCGYYPEKQ